MWDFKEIMVNIETGKFWKKLLWFMALWLVIFYAVAELGSALKISLEQEKPGRWRALLILLSFALALVIFLFVLTRTTFKVWFHKYRLRTKGGYISQLAKNFNQMPFIYPEFNISETLSIREDYVIASYKYFPIRKSDGLFNDQFPEILTACANSMLANCSRVLLFGQAGMGKTSFLHHTILNIIYGDKTIADFNPFRDNQKVLPIFVPLKILSNETPFPIIRHILRTPFFAGEKGMQRLLRLAEEKKIALFLDGYDEIIIRKESKNSIIRELNFIFSGDFKKEKDQSDEVNEFYRLLKKFNSVWLTSRLSFFAQHPLNLVSDEHELRKNRVYYEGFVKDKLRESESRTTVGSIIISGIQEKTKLIEKLIEKYLRKEPSFSEVLTIGKVLDFVDEYFNFSELDVMDNPLFLTIFFYIYVKVHVEQEEKLDHPLTLKMAVELCTDLILRDLDRSKVRGLSHSGIHQRLQFDPDEKKEFIKYFAYQYYVNKKLQGKGSFTEQELYDVGSLYGEKYMSLNSSKGNEKTQKLVYEILSQNFFIVVADDVATRYYDFPHRRFKEFFAIDFFNTGDNFNLLLQHVEDPLFYDFIILYHNSSTENSEKLLDYLMATMKTSRSLGKPYSLFNECILQKKFNSSKFTLQNFVKFLVYDLKVELVSSELINSKQIEHEILLEMEIRLRGFINNGNATDFFRISKIYLQIEKEAATSFLFGYALPRMVKETILSDGLLSFLYTNFDAQRVSKEAVAQFDNSDFSTFLTLLTRSEIFSKSSDRWTEIFQLFSIYQKEQFILWATDYINGPDFRGQNSSHFMRILAERYAIDSGLLVLKAPLKELKELLEIIIRKIEADKRPDILELMYQQSNDDQRQVLAQVIFEKIHSSSMFDPLIETFSIFLLKHYSGDLCFQAVGNVLNDTNAPRIIEFFTSVEFEGSKKNLLNDFRAHLNAGKLMLVSLYS